MGNSLSSLGKGLKRKPIELVVGFSVWFRIQIGGE